MKIGYAGVDLPEGKVKFDDSIVHQLTEKCKPKKVSPFYVEFIPDDFVQTDAAVVSEDKILDLLIADMEKCDARLQRSEQENEKVLMQKCLQVLEKEMLLCETDFSAEELKLLHAIAPISMKPILKVTEQLPVNDIIKQVLEKAGVIFFYTAGPEEVHAWNIMKGTEIISCAGKIHSDLERGFIKGDVVSFDDFMQSHNFNDAKKKGLVKMVDKDYEVKPSDIIEIRFNV